MNMVNHMGSPEGLHGIRWDGLGKMFCLEKPWIWDNTARLLLEICVEGLALSKFLLVKAS